MKLPAIAVEALGRARDYGSEFFFWSGKGDAIARTWMNRMKKLFDRAEIEAKGNMVSHRWRDAFAVECLLADGSMEDL